MRVTLKINQVTEPELRAAMAAYSHVVEHRKMLSAGLEGPHLYRIETESLPFEDAWQILEAMNEASAPVGPDSEYLVVPMSDPDFERLLAEEAAIEKKKGDS